MKRKFLDTLYGIYKDLHRRMIPENRLPDGVNIYFSEGKIKRRPGYTQLGNQLNGAVMALKWYELLGTANKFLVAFTTRDAYYYDSSSSTWKFITKIYNTGSATCSATTAVTGTGTTWDNSWPDGYYQLKFGTSDPNATGTPDTWYTVSAVTATNAMTLTTAGPTATTVAYVLRCCSTNDEDQPHDIAMPVNSSSARILVATNGTEEPRSWTGAGYMTALGSGTTAPNISRYCGYFGSVGYEHLFLGWTVDAGVDQPFTVELSDVGEPDVWTEGTYYDLMNTNDEIVGFQALGQNVVIYKTDSISVARPTGNSSDPLSVNQNHINGIGTPSIRTVADFGNFHIFMGNDHIYRFDGLQLIPIGVEIVNTLLSELNSGKRQRCFAIPIRNEHLYCLFIPTADDNPDKAYVYNYQDNNWTIWEFAHHMTAAWYWFPDSSETWASVDAAGTTWADWLADGRTWTDMLRFAGSAVYVFGDEDGYVYQWSGTNDDGTNIDASFTTRDYPINDPVSLVKLLQLILGLESGTGTLRCRASVDFGGEWSEWVTINQAGTTNYIESIANFLLRGKQARFQVENVDGAYFEIESLSVGYNDAGV